MNGCYKVVNRNLEWAVAALKCRSLHKDAHLLVINDAQEQSAVGELLDAVNGQCQPGAALVSSPTPFRLAASVSWC